ncbi:MAG: inositol monophosphatase family protein [Chloroflexota bacterium]
MPNLDALLQFTHALLDETDAIATELFRGELTITAKHDRTLVTQADTGVETRLRERILAEFPTHGIVGEEFGTEPGDGETRWIIDPIDGTHNFVRGIPIWATLVALERDGQLVLGAASAPALGTRWAATAGGGARIRTANDERPMGVSRIATMSEAQVISSSLRAMDGAGMGDGLHRAVNASWRDRGFGDFWGYTLVAQGAAEAMVEVGPTIWDLAAPYAIVTEAGGRMTDLEGRPSWSGPTVLATNGILHEEMLSLLGG